MKELKDIQVSLKVSKDKKEKSGKYSYRSVEDITEALKPHLEITECAVTLTDDIVMVGNRIYVKATATITNKNGESVSTNGFARESEGSKFMSDGQLTGASSSYARKYALCGLFCIDSGQDLDGQPVEVKKAVNKFPELSKKLLVCTKLDELMILWEDNVDMQSDKSFQLLFTKRKKELTA